MDTTAVLDEPRMTARRLRPLLGGSVTVRTPSALLRGTLLSCVRGSAWFVVDDADVLIDLDEITWIVPA